MKHARLYAAAGAVIALDRLTKALLADADRVLIPGLFALRGTRNTGMAFGLLAGGGWFLILVTALFIAGALLYVRNKSLPRLGQYGLGLLLGGAAGNLVDRVLWGYVIDFIEPLFVRFAVFNLADVGVTVGTGLLLIYLLFGKEDASA